MQFITETFNCKVCKKVLTRNNLADNSAVYHKSFGMVCIHHHGIDKLYKELWDKAVKDMKKILYII